MPKPKTTAADPSPFAYKQVRDPKTGAYSYVRLVSPQIPDYILSTGNPAVLDRFYQEHQATLTAADRKYLSARIHTAYKMERLRNANIRKIANEEPPVTPAITNNKGFRGINIKYDGPQTSANGCWSNGFSLLLKTRGVDLSPEEIRAWRPNYEPGQEQRMSQQSRFSMDCDSLSKVYENADIIQEVLPNTAVNSVSLNPLPAEFSMNPMNNPPLPPKPYIENEDFLTEEDRMQVPGYREYRNALNKNLENARKAYKQVLKKQIGTLVRNALEKDKSPLIMNIGSNHFVTITGISKHNNRLRIEDSMRSLDKTTQIKYIDDLIDEYLISRPMKEVNGITLTWLKDIPVPKAENKGEEPISIHEAPVPENTEPAVQNANAAPPIAGPAADADAAKKAAYKGAVKINPQNGTLTLSEPEGTFVGKRTDPDETIGHLRGQEISDTLLIDQNDIRPNLNGASIYPLGEEELYGPGKIFFGTMQTYYPKKVCFPGDPNLQSQQLTEDLKNRKEMSDKLMARVRQEKRQARPEENTFGSYIYDHQTELYRQNPDTAYYLARIYASNMVLNQLENVPANRLTMPMTQEHRQAIEQLAVKMTPTINGILATKTGKVELPHLAVKEDPSQFILKVSDFADIYAAAGNQDREEKHAVINDALQAMTNTGTGRNYIGVRRSRNDDEYNELIDELQSYSQTLSQGRNPDGPDSYNLIQKGLKYIDNKKTVRSTTDGKIRFDSTMRILKQIMPTDEFRVLCNQINRAREVANQPANENFVKPEDYEPMTLQRYVNNQLKDVSRIGSSELKKRLGNIIAAREIAKNRNPEHPEKAIVIFPSTVKQDTEAISARSREIRRSQIIASTVDDYNHAQVPQAFEHTWRHNAGENLEARYQNARAQSPALNS